ncbi:MAG: chromosomal replication initiator protein DnaA [Planctomycetes bacterium]|nr:chromosomal replication initiator protein DnaA [Planctomycetota bacterium]
MTSTPTTLWEDLLGHVRLNHPELVRGWFADLGVVKLELGVLEILARNPAQCRYLEQHCARVFTEAAQAATGRLVSVSFRAEVEADDDRHAADGYAFEDEREQLRLKPDYTFEHFVTGPCNRLAHAAALSVAQEPGRSYNPLFVYGPVGLGKTHLLQAVCHAIRTAQPSARFYYISCETFINHFIEAVERGALNRFRYRYRGVDGLVIDDIQFLAERERSQEEFFHTFNTLHHSQRQIILSADCSPSEIPSLEERLVSRFNSGLVALLDRPCLETRMAIIRKKAKLRCIEVPEDVIRLVAARIESNIRELEGALLKLDALSQTRSGKITLELAQEALGASSGERGVSVPAVLDAVARRFGVKVSELQSKRRSREITHPRHLCMYLCRQLTSKSLEEIGGYFGGRDHTTVLHAVRTITEEAAADASLQRLLSELSLEARQVG